MNKHIRNIYTGLLCCTVLINGCNRESLSVELTPGLKISLPATSDITSEKPQEGLKTWQVSFEDDHLKIFDYEITTSDTIRGKVNRDSFRKNIDSFLRPFSYRDIDSTFTVNGKMLQCDLSFDFSEESEDYRLYTRFILSDDSFIAFCFQTPFPVDRYSVSVKNKLFNSIVIN